MLFETSSTPAEVEAPRSGRAGCTVRAVVQDTLTVRPGSAPPGDTADVEMAPTAAALLLLVASRTRTHVACRRGVTRVRLQRPEAVLTW